MPAARTYADLPGGHSEGYDDTQSRRCGGSIARWRIAARPSNTGSSWMGCAGLQIVEKVLESSKKRAWVDV